MAFTRLNFRCTYAEEERWKAEARKTGRSLSAWLRWLANTASNSPIEDRVSVPGTGVRTEVSPFAIPGVRTAAEVAEREMVDWIEFVRPATWKLIVGGDVVWESTQRAGDPRSKNWARADLEKYCVQKDVGGFWKAWEAHESEMSDGGFSL